MTGLLVNSSECPFNLLMISNKYILLIANISNKNVYKVS